MIFKHPYSNTGYRKLFLSFYHREVDINMKGLRPKGYTRRVELFKNWKPAKIMLCPVCGIGYITYILTGVSVIYIHGNDLLCQEFNDE